MKQIDELLEEWRKDSDIDRTEPGKALLDIPKLHSKYLNILSRHRLLAKEAEFKYNKWKKLKWEYYTGKLDDDELAQQWEYNVTDPTNPQVNYSEKSNTSEKETM